MIREEIDQRSAEMRAYSDILRQRQADMDSAANNFLIALLGYFIVLGCLSGVGFIGVLVWHFTQ